jgi:hypothetical protein
LAGTVWSEESLVWRTAVEGAALILFEGGGITVANELMLLVFEPELTVDRLLEMNEAGSLLGIVADRRVSLLKKVRLEGIGWVCESTNVQPMDSITQR